MSRPPFFCTWNTGGFGEQKPCLSPTPGDGKELCQRHRDRLPIWPVNDDGSPCAP